MTGWKSAAAAMSALVLGGLAGGCNIPVEADYPNEDRQSRGQVIYDSELKQRESDSVFGDGGLDLFNLGGKKNRAPEGPGIAVNSFLWRATLDTIAFMPLASADPFGGVIITDWYTPPEAPQERFKMSVYIMGRELRADGVKVAVFHQRANGTGDWVASAVATETATNLENQILTRARQLRLASAQLN